MNSINILDTIDSLNCFKIDREISVLIKNPYFADNNYFIEFKNTLYSPLNSGFYNIDVTTYN